MEYNRKKELSLIQGIVFNNKNISEPWEKWVKLTYLFLIFKNLTVQLDPKDRNKLEDEFDDQLIKTNNADSIDEIDKHIDFVKSLYKKFDKIESYSYYVENEKLKIIIEQQAKKLEDSNFEMKNLLEQKKILEESINNNDKELEIVKISFNEDLNKYKNEIENLTNQLNEKDSLIQKERKSFIKTIEAQVKKIAELSKIE